MVIGDYVFDKEESIDELINIIEELVYKEIYEKVPSMYKKFLLECLEADKRLENMVSNKFGDDYTPLCIIPYRNIDNLEGFYFALVPKDENQKVKKRDEIVFFNFCEICFGHIKPFIFRARDYYSEFLE